MCIYCIYLINEVLLFLLVFVVTERLDNCHFFFTNSLVLVVIVVLVVVYLSITTKYFKPSKKIYKRAI